MTALTLYEDGKFDIMQRTAKALAASGYFKDATDMAKAIVKVMAGAELGLPPFAAMTGIHIIQGKPVLGANALATLIKNDPRYDYRVKQLDDKGCVIAFFENGEHVGDSSFTNADAQKAGTQNVSKFPRNMFFARAISNGAKWYTPGIFGGSPIYTPEDFGMEVDADGVLIDSTPQQAQAPQDVEIIDGEATAVTYTDAQQTICDAPAADFFDIATALIDRYDNVHATKNAAKKLGFKAVPQDCAARVAMFDAIAEHAASRDAEEAQDEQE